MAVDKLVDSTQLDTDLTSVANAIRAKSGRSAQMAFPNGFVSAVQTIPTGQPVSFGLIAQIDVTEPVFSIRQNLPRIAAEYGLLRVDVDLTFNQSDYFYAGFTTLNGDLTDNNGYAHKSTNANYTIWPSVLIPSNYSEDYAEDNIIVCTVGFYNMRARYFPVGTEMTDFYCKVYNGDSRIIGGSVKIYGRVS